MLFLLLFLCNCKKDSEKDSEKVPAKILVKLDWWHQNIENAYTSRISIPSSHIKVHNFFTSVIPPSHPNIDTLFQDPSKKIPVGHPKISDYIEYNQRLLRIINLISIPYWHTSIDDSFINLENIPKNHLSIKLLMKDNIPYNHPDVDNILQHISTNQLPLWHTKIDKFLIKRNNFRSGSILLIITISIIVCISLVKFVYKLIKINKDTEIQYADTNAVDIDNETGCAEIIVTKDSINTLPHRDLLLNKIDKNNKIDNLINFTSERRGVQKQITYITKIKNRLNNYRILGTEFTILNILTAFSYVLLNMICVINREEVSLNIGSLAVSNITVVIILATRNSILTVLLRIPFDHLILYHRWVGRWMLLLSIIHGCMYSVFFVNNITEYVNYTGFIALLFGLIIFISSINWVRRMHFNIFYWSHFSFLGLIVFAYLHVKETCVFILIGVGFYILDRILRISWSFFPRKTLLFRKKSDDICQVRFNKNPLSRHKVGQYYFVNFPYISLTEWHPFSVSSGPRENYIEINIRGLGDHTKEINKYAETHDSTLIRFEGPYGLHNFNYRRFPILFMSGGGIGITPIIGILKDIYDINTTNEINEINEINEKDKKDKKLKHHNNIINVIWIIPFMENSKWFMDELQICMDKSLLPCYPSLNLSIHVTKENKEYMYPFIYGRPNFNLIFENLPNIPILAFACGPSKMVEGVQNQSLEMTKKGFRVDFYHEVFEF